MVESFYSLVIIAIGIIGANLTFLFNKKNSIGLVSNCIIGAFVSILTIKILSRFGFEVHDIRQGGHINYLLMIVNFIVSLFAGYFSVVMFKKIVMRSN